MVACSGWLTERSQVCSSISARYRDETHSQTTYYSFGFVSDAAICYQYADCIEDIIVKKGKRVTATDCCSLGGAYKMGKRSKCTNCDGKKQQQLGFPLQCLVIPYYVRVLQEQHHRHTFGHNGQNGVVAATSKAMIRGTQKGDKGRKSDIATVS